jgi:hypothetical protein
LHLVATLPGTLWYRRTQASRGPVHRFGSRYIPLSPESNASIETPPDYSEPAAPPSAPPKIHRRSSRRLAVPFTNVRKVEDPQLDAESRCSFDSDDTMVCAEEIQEFNISSIVATAYRSAVEAPTLWKAFVSGVVDDAGGYDGEGRNNDCRASVNFEYLRSRATPGVWAAES